MPITNEHGENVEGNDFNTEVNENTQEETHEENVETTTENEVDKHMSAESPEAKRARLKRQLEQHDKKFGFKDEIKPSKAKKSEDFDYGQKAFLVASGVSKDNFELVKEIMSGTGKSIEDVLESKYFKAELKERQDANSAREATPTTSKRIVSSPSDSVDYWINKGELPPTDQVELRRKVVNEKIKRANDKKNPFR
jgi:hypothetical protein